MGETLTLQRMLEMHRIIWNFRINSGNADDEALAREQVRSFRQMSRTALFLSLPFLVLISIFLVANAGTNTAIFAGLCFAVASFSAYRNVTRSYPEKDADQLQATFRTIMVEASSVAVVYSCLLSLPVAFGAVPVTGALAILAVGSIIVGGFAYGSIPKAQTLFITIYTTITAIAYVSLWQLEPVTTAVFIIITAVVTDWIYRVFFFNFAQRHLHSARLRHAVDTVRFLLNDYAEQSSDWLWELDGNLQILNPTRRFAVAAGHDISQLRGKSFAEIFEDSTERNALQQHLTSAEAFRDVLIPLQVHGERRWWKIAGRPVSGTSGSGTVIRGVATDITAAKRAEDRVNHLAHFDYLTDLPNRALFLESLQRSIARRPEDRKIALLYIDIDNFKAINDTMGHASADELLKSVASRLEKTIGIEDVVARMSGDEFVVALRNVESTEDALDRSQDFLAALSTPVMVCGQLVNASASIGIAMTPEHADNAETLIKFADVALYDAKKRGKGCVSLFSAEMRTAFEDRQSIESDLRKALTNGDLELYYQPLINIETTEILGYEALTRWNHPEKGLIMPSVFIPAAEESGMIVPLGEWTIRSALMEAARWPEHLSVAVNLSPLQMRSANLIPTIVNALAASGVAANRLELEITETVLMTDDDSNVTLLHKIRALGVRIALDDFGTGYSSLNYLRSFPFDKIKIDRCFVKDVADRDDCRAIIRAVTGLASSLGMVTTAEGVERGDQLQWLREEGCGQVQGYLFSRAMPAESVEGRRPAETPATPPVERLEQDRPDAPAVAVNHPSTSKRKSA